MVAWSRGCGITLRRNVTTSSWRKKAAYVTVARKQREKEDLTGDKIHPPKSYPPRIYFLQALFPRFHHLPIMPQNKL